MLGMMFSGLTVSDRWSAYLMIAAERRQVCWSHLQRDFQGFIDRGGGAKAFGEAGVALAKELFTIWHRYQGAEIGRRRMQEQMTDLEVRVGELLGGGLKSKVKKVRGFCNELLELGPALFLFARVEGVEPSNNLAERMLRAIVLWRKGSFGTWSDAGSRFVERIMTVVMTCRLQGRPVLGYIRELLTAQDHGTKMPSLFGKRSRDGPKLGEPLPCKRSRKKTG
jgi:transposase